MVRNLMMIYWFIWRIYLRHLSFHNVLLYPHTDCHSHCHWDCHWDFFIEIVIEIVIEIGIEVVIETIIYIVIEVVIEIVIEIVIEVVIEIVIAVAVWLYFVYWWRACCSSEKLKHIGYRFYLHNNTWNIVKLQY